MRPFRSVATLAATALTVFAPARGAHAQTTSEEMTATQIAVSCAPVPRLAPAPTDGLFIVGSQDPVGRTLFGRPELLVIEGGTAQGVAAGQQYFVRRVERFGRMYRDRMAHSVQTAGWVRVVAVNETTSVATVEHACGDILAGDHLEPFEPPTVPADVTEVDTSKEPDFSALGRVLYGQSERRTAGAGDFMMIDRGTEAGVTPGERFAIYRDLHLEGVPLASIGEATAVSIGARMSLVRITRARDAVMSGDFVAPRTK